jgi:nucleoside-diphosphate-sugar epimerase
MARVKFTILGAQGFIGRHLVNHLRIAGHEVVGADAGQLTISEKCLGNVVYAIGLTGDFRSRPYDTVEAHVSLLSRMLQTLSFQSLTYLSTTRIYATLAPNKHAHEEDEILLKPGSDSLYDLSKLTGEALCLSSPNPFVRVARLSNVYGLGMSKNTFLGSIIDDLLIRKTVEIGEAPLSAKDYVSVSDVCKCLEYISIHGRFRLYNVASGRNTTHAEIARRLRVTTDAEINFKPESKIRKFPLISIERLLGEFEFVPKSLVQDLASLFDAQTC